MSKRLASSVVAPKNWTKVLRAGSKPRAHTSSWIADRMERQRSSGPSNHRVPRELPDPDCGEGCFSRRQDIQ
jgi:hypothetical protein